MEWGLEMREGVKCSSCSFFRLLRGLKHLHDRFDPFHAKPTLWVANVKL